MGPDGDFFLDVWSSTVRNGFLEMSSLGIGW